MHQLKEKINRYIVLNILRTPITLISIADSLTLLAVNRFIIKGNVVNGGLYAFDIN